MILNTAKSATAYTAPNAKRNGDIITILEHQPGHILEYQFQTEQQHPVHIITRLKRGRNL